MDILQLLQNISEKAISWPFIIFVMATSIITTIGLNFVQLRYFFTAWKNCLFPEASQSAQAGDMTPTQAFISTLSSNLGNGSLAGVGTAIALGGPGATFWLVLFGFFMMAIRFAEVYLSVHYGALADMSKKDILGGPMLYLQELPFGAVLAYIFAVFCFLFGVMGGNAIQANSISVSLQETWNINPYITASILFAIVAYILGGGASRIVKFSDAIVPVKVFIFFATSLSVLAYHYQSLIPSLILICKSAFGLEPFIAATLGFTIQRAVQYGMMRQIFATESGIGTAAIFFGFTGSKDAIASGFLGMISTFVSTLVCFIVALCIVASGAWKTDLTSTALTIASFRTVFGNAGGWIVSVLSITFGIGVLIAYAYVVRATWFVVTNGRWNNAFIVIYCLAAFGGAIIGVRPLWQMSDIIQVCMMIINLTAIIYLLPVIRAGIISYDQRSKNRMVK